MLGTGAIVSIVAVVLTFIISIITFFRKKLFFRQRAKTQKDNHKTNGEERISVKQEVPKIKITDPEELEQKPVSEDQLEEKNDVKTQDEGEESEKDEKEETKFEIETQNDEEENEINESFEIDAKINAPINHKIIENFYGDTVIEKNTQEEEEIKETVQDELEPEKQNEAINPQDSLVEEETISEQETPKEEETQEIQKEEETQEIQKEEEKEIESAVESISPQSEEKETKEEEEPEIEEKQEKPQENLAISVQEFTPKEEQQTQEQKTEEILSPLPEKSPEPEIFHKPENLFIERKKQELNESEIGISPSPILSPALLYLSANSPTTTNEENNSKSSDLSTIPLLDSSPTSSNLDISTNSDTNLRASEDLLSDVPTDTNFDSDDEEVDSDEDRGKEPEITEETEIPEQEDQELIEFRKKEVKRSYILKEFVQTEINYCHQLDNLLKYYAEPLKMGVRSKNNPSGSKLEKIIDTEVAKKIFADVGVIHGINSAFKIQLQLIVNAQGGIKEEQLATLLLKQGFPHFHILFFLEDSNFSWFSALSFRLYSSFVTNYKTAAAEIEKERKKNKKFVEFLNQTQDEMRKSGESNFEVWNSFFFFLFFNKFSKIFPVIESFDHSNPKNSKISSFNGRFNPLGARNNPQINSRKPNRTKFRSRNKTQKLERNSLKIETSFGTNQRNCRIRQRKTKANASIGSIS